ncbi:hypothetical protein [Neobacillus sp. PS2-9]|uniref:hypothetical protein n=1 Tax=Neobacillus sp. PS2-9 TaxID=3070676 RepID=UPI0027DFDF8A|nr:hypothetical protein [Neobacillus sp. PS2-9]WML58862.1 hypothetical protein RCG25_03420 [Neobacillus sp. PS2-9]
MKKTLQAVALVTGLTLLSSPVSSFAATNSTTVAKYQNQWVKKDSYWTYYNTSGALQKGWFLLNSKWYFFDASGIMKTGWVPFNNKWYYFTTSGAMKTGWVYVSNKWYYLDNSGAMKTGWLKIGPDWYFLNSNGSMKTGWLQSGGKWYFLDLSSGKMLLGWNIINGKTYFFYSTGMVTNITIEGKVIGADGAVIEENTILKKVSDLAAPYGVTVEYDAESDAYDLFYGKEPIGFVMPDGLIMGDPAYGELFNKLALAVGIPVTEAQLNDLVAQAKENGEVESGDIYIYINNDEDTYMISWGSEGE